MNELLKGLIGAELTLLGIPSQPGASSATEDSSAAKADHGGTSGASSDTAHKPDEAGSRINFTQRDYRTAGG
ncbi:hypothetical protein [Bordetella sp. H567]|uniref:hypothetical protein n=1 Tax=Bordetella sp. H567 TaxID=1697043 RepID=UPI0011AB7040|nr:hypothetical protein [Bordetella sp. H567]